MVRRLSKEQETVQIGNQSVGARQRESFQVMMPVAEESRRPDWRERSKQMVRVVATWNNFLSQLASTRSGFLNNAASHGKENACLQTQFGFKSDGERFLNVFFLFISSTS